jgi:hypothetical protein
LLVFDINRDVWGAGLAELDDSADGTTPVNDLMTDEIGGLLDLDVVRLFLIDIPVRLGA